MPVGGLDRNRRRSLGIYYTPPEAARLLASWAIRNPNETILEPSFGGCSMLSAAVEVFASLGKNQPSEQLFGFDVDAEAFKYLAGMGLDNADGQFKKRDFLRSQPGEFLVDAVLANPPFVSYHRSDKAQREAAEHLRQRYLPQLPKRASLWAHFLLHSMSFLRPGGRMAFVLPNAIGSADYAKPLLNFLQHRFLEIDLVHVGERLFIQEGADERISLLLLNQYIPGGITSPKRFRSRHIESINEFLPETQHIHESGKSKNPENTREIAAAALATLEGSALSLLGSSASVQIGEVVGDIRFFVRTASEWRAEHIGPRHLMPLLTRSGQIRGLFVPRKQSGDENSPIPLLLLPPTKRLPKGIDSYLERYPASSIKTNRTFEKRPVWHRCSYSTNADAFISSMNHDIPRIVGNEGGISCSNAFYKIILHERPELASWLPILSLTTPLRLSAEVLGRVRGSGGIKLEPSDVKRLCLPVRLPFLSKKEFNNICGRISKMVANGEIDAASQLSDFLVYLQPGLIDAGTMSDLRLLRLRLTSYRLPNQRSKSAQLSA